MWRWAVVLAPVAGCDLALGLNEPRRSDAAGVIDTAMIDAKEFLDAPAIRRNCKDAQSHGVTTNGVLTIDPDDAGPEAPFQVYCDMTTAGGGWTLAYSYGFTNYDNFMANNNAVTPRPDWGVPASNSTPVSTVTPTSPTMNGAMPFARWKDIGSELLVTSTINNWVRCTPGTGSLVTLTQGSVTCVVENVVVNMCTTTKPNGFGTQNNGPALTVGGGTNFYYYFDGSTSENWPTHDPCGTNQPNHLKGAANPRGAIYLR